MLPWEDKATPLHVDNLNGKTSYKLQLCHLMVRFDARGSRQVQSVQHCGRGLFSCGCKAWP
jgi:hypothetical protein